MHADSGAVLASTCPNCATSGALTYCPKCGQKAPASHEYSPGHLFHDLFHELMHVDGKIVRTLRLMLLAPGQITLDYWEGRRARYLTPFRIYLLATAAFFALVKISGSLQTGALAELANRFPAEQIDGRFQLFYKGLMVFSVAGLALLFRWLLGKRPYGAYMIAALHSLSVLFVLTLAAQMAENALRPFVDVPPGVFALAALPLAYWPYVAVSMKRWTDSSWVWVVGRMVLLIVGTMVVDSVVYVAAIGATIASFARGA